MSLAVRLALHGWWLHKLCGPSSCAGVLCRRVLQWLLCCAVWRNRSLSRLHARPVSAHSALDAEFSWLVVTFPCT